MSAAEVTHGPLATSPPGTGAVGADTVPRARPSTGAPLLVSAPAVLAVGWVAAAGAIALTPVLAALPGDTGLAVAAGVAVVMLALGTPHGALDHLTVAREGRQPRAAAPPGRPAHPAGRLLGVLRSGTAGLGPRFVAGYLGCAAVALAAYLAAPRLGFAAFLVLSVAHFAAGEAGVAVERGLARGWRDPLAWAAAAGGSAVVVLPLASPQATAAVAAVDPRLGPVLAPMPAVAAGVVALSGLALLACAVLARAGGARARAVGVVAAELAGLLAVATLAHPLLAFAAYYGAWHALRHQARLADEVAPAAPPPGRGGGGRDRRHAPSRSTAESLGRVAVSALPGVPASVAVLVVAALLGLAGQSLLGGLLAVVWALTVPHSLAVARLELRRARERRVGRRAAA